MSWTRLAFAAWLQACSCGAGDHGALDASGVLDAALDAGSADAMADRELDGAMDAAADGGLESLPECRPLYRDWWPTTAYTGDSSVERTDTEYEFAVVEVRDGHLRLEADADADPKDEPTIVLDWPTGDPRAVLPLPGDRVLALGGMCYETGYYRVMTLERELLWEGGDPGCTSYRNAYPWGPYLSQRPAEPDGWCKDLMNPFDEYPEGDCCCVTRSNFEVLLSLPGADPVVLPAGDVREVEIDGATFAVFSQGAYARYDGPCTADVTTPYGVGSAYLMRVSR